MTTTTKRKPRTKSMKTTHPIAPKKPTVKKPPTVIPNKDPKPEPLFGEPLRAFHIRAIFWVVKESPGCSYPEIVIAMREQIGAKVTTEVATCVLKVLETRGWVTGVILEGQDQRRVNWYAVKSGSDS